jgi:DNA-directed RNA polymerase subunit RPC12/RpoP
VTDVRIEVVLAVSQMPQVRCYQCHEVFHSRADLATTTHHCRCPYCSAINGVPATHIEPARAEAGINVLAATRSTNLIASLATDQQEQLLRRLQSREISPLVCNASLRLAPLRPHATMTPPAMAKT